MVHLLSSICKLNHQFRPLTAEYSYLIEWKLSCDINLHCNICQFFSVIKLTYCFCIFWSYHSECVKGHIDSLWIRYFLQHNFVNFYQFIQKIFNNLRFWQWTKPNTAYFNNWKWCEMQMSTKVLTEVQDRSWRSGRSGHGRTTFSAELIISLLFDSLYIQHIIVQNSLQTVYSDSQLRSMFEDCWIKEPFRRPNLVC